MTEATKNLAANLQALLEQRSLSQSQLSERSGVSQKTISNIVRSESSPTLDNIEKIAQALRVSVSDLLNENPEGKKSNSINSVASSNLAEEAASMLKCFLLLPEGQRKSLLKTALAYLNA